MRPKEGQSAGRFLPIPIFPSSKFGYKAIHGFPFRHPYASYWVNARAALWQGLQVLDLAPGDRILVPVYACGSEIDVLLKFGLVPVWYPVDERLQIDLNWLESTDAAVGARALFVIHYFGFPQPLSTLRTYADERNLALIEDNAHGLLSQDATGTPLGSVGDISIFSLYKSLPISAGGMLVVRDAERSSRVPRGIAPPLRFGLGKTKQLLERTLAARHPRAAAFLYLSILDPLVALIKQRSLKLSASAAAGVPAPDKSVDFEITTAQWSMPRIALLQLGGSGGEDLQLQRRCNYERLDAALQNNPHFRPLFAELPAGCCPLFFPLLMRNGRRGLRRHLLNAGIECHGFGFSHPQIPEHEYAWERELKQSLVCLPLHQSLDDAKIQHIIRSVNGWRDDDQVHH